MSNSLVRQDSKCSQSSNEQASMLLSMCSESSLETNKVVHEAKHVSKKLGEIVDNVFSEQEELMSRMDWNFLEQKNS